MDECKEGQGAATSQKQQGQVEQSPSEKLADNNVIASRVPGAENPESEEVKNEVNPNTE